MFSMIYQHCRLNKTQATRRMARGEAIVVKFTAFGGEKVDIEFRQVRNKELINEAKAIREAAVAAQRRIRSEATARRRLALASSERVVFSRTVE
jgi:hypothetical protein